MNTPAPAAHPTLLPCPYPDCGEPAAFGRCTDPAYDDFGGEYVYCTSLTCQESISPIFPRSPDVDVKPLLAQFWNHRHRPASKLAAAQGEPSPALQLLGALVFRMNVRTAFAAEKGQSSVIISSGFAREIESALRQADLYINGAQE